MTELHKDEDATCSSYAVSIFLPAVLHALQKWKTIMVSTFLLNILKVALSIVHIPRIAVALKSPAHLLV